MPRLHPESTIGAVWRGCVAGPSRCTGPGMGEDLLRRGGFERVVRIAVLMMGVLGGPSLAEADDGLEFFETKIRPVLVEHCYECHSSEASSLEGELRLDLKAGWQSGGASGEAAIVPGDPAASLLIRMVRHVDGVSPMPPDAPPLPAATIADLETWIRSGAPDPRTGAMESHAPPSDWETSYRQRLEWWSLKSIAAAQPSEVKDVAWPRNDVDRYVLAALEAKSLRPSGEADARVLVRRLSFALTGLPPSPELVERFAADRSPAAFDNLLNHLLGSPRFGEHWARHWMDVVHYCDTHGYEWDVPAKNAWRYRDYLVRAFNADVSFRQLVLEQIAGDLIEPRIDPRSGINEALIGPMALRLGERRHGDNSLIEGISQEAVQNMIDTIGKGFLGTTIACAQCHDHKLDAVEQRDYYALAGVLMSTRWSARTLDAVDPNEAVIERLRAIKQRLRSELARLWLDSKESLTGKIRAIPADEKVAQKFPETLAEFWQRSLTAPVAADAFVKEREHRIAANRERLTLLADFTDPSGSRGWRWDGLGMRHGLVADGEFVVADEGEAALMQILPAGRWSHLWSQRLAGSLQSPLLDVASPLTLSVELAAGNFAAHAFIVDQALHSERMQFLNQPAPRWLTLTAGNFQTLEGSLDTAPRRVYLEIATKALNNYFPPRTGYGGVTEAAIADQRSWFGVTRVYQHPPGQPPLDELTRFAPLFEQPDKTGPPQGDGDWAEKLADLVLAAVERWAAGTCSSEDVRLLNDALGLQLLPNSCSAQSGHASIAKLVAEYRAVEKTLEPDRTIGSAAEWDEGQNERIGLRGSYTHLGEAVERGGIRLLDGPHHRRRKASSGRLELAESLVAPDNPLTARVYVNRVWQAMFGEGLVRTPDDFGHLGQPPSHPELLDYLATRFMREGWSTKKLVALLASSATWRQTSLADPHAVVVDPENRLWHHMPLRRLSAEAIRDSILAVSGHLDRALDGPPIEPFRTAADPSKRLQIGPLDGLGRRSLYIEMTLMEPPRFLALFNQPMPKLTTGRRDVTNVPDQALALLNDPFVVEMARQWSERLVADDAETPAARAAQMLAVALARSPQPEEIARLVRLVERSAQLRGASLDRDSADSLLECQPAWQDAAHAIFNLKEFIYVP